jgi:hypothetical protein
MKSCTPVTTIGMIFHGFRLLNLSVGRQNIRPRNNHHRFDLSDLAARCRGLCLYRPCASGRAPFTL